jgi:extracellular factor (EF) 3-hydroxypalmitic acid methyl ester biosynthesis protein
LTKSYEELVGAFGRGIFFRPERKRVRDLLSRDAEPRLLVGGETYKLFDVSMNGLSFEYPQGQTPWQAGSEVELTLQLYGDSAYRGQARVVRVKPHVTSSRVAVTLTSGFLDLPDMIRRDEEGRLVRELHGGADEVYRRVPESYRDVIARAVHFVQYYKRTLDRHEARLKVEVASAAERTRELCEQAVEGLRPQWREIERAAAESAVSFLDDPRAVRAAKEYTEAALTPLLMGAPMVRRSYLKPLGYPGDYQTMLYTYANTFEGAGAFDQVFHKLHVEHPLAHGIRTRKDFIVEQMQLEHDNAIARGAEEYRVTSLGCGPAREVVDFVRSRSGWPGKVAWTLIDQEEETLSVAYRDGQKALMENHARGELSCLNLSFGQLLADTGSVLSTAPQQDFVYSVGLFDYLREGRAQALVQTLYERLRPGGLLAIGNAIAPNLHFWALELLLDWTLLYRTRSQMSKLAARLPSQAEISVATEPGQAYFFLLVRRH